MLSALYGGTAFSKLFMNVREKMSLCYYADSHFERGSGILIVDCGIEFENREKAQSEIIRQLELVAKGEFTEEEFENILPQTGDNTPLMLYTVGLFTSIAVFGLLRRKIKCT